MFLRRYWLVDFLPSKFGYSKADTRGRSHVCACVRYTCSYRFRGTSGRRLYISEIIFFLSYYSYLCCIARVVEPLMAVKALYNTSFPLNIFLIEDLMRDPIVSLFVSLTLMNFGIQFHKFHLYLSVLSIFGHVRKKINEALMSSWVWCMLHICVLIEMLEFSFIFVLCVFIMFILSSVTVMFCITANKRKVRGILLFFVILFFALLLLFFVMMNKVLIHELSIDFTYRLLISRFFACART